MSIVGLLWGPGGAWAQSAAPGTTSRVDVLPPTIPIFPLQDVVLFPNSTRTLYIFEPRYRSMVADAWKGDRIIGMVLLQPGYEADYEGRPPVYPIGCAGVMTDVQPQADGRYVIVLRGVVKFRIHGEDQSRAYRLAHVEPMPEPLNDAERSGLGQRRPRLTTLLTAALGGAVAVPPAVPDEDLVDALAQQLDFDPIKRQELLVQKGSLARADALIKLLEMRINPPR
jgi:Lon protease-like protein